MDNEKIRKLKSLFLLTQEPETVLQGVIRSSLVNVIARGLGYLRQISIAILLGFSYQTDGFFMAVSLIGIFLIFSDVFDSVGVPQLVVAKEQGQNEFKRLAGLLFTFTLGLSLIMLVLSLLLMPLILKIPAGFSSEALETTKISYLLLIPYMVLNFIFHHFGAVLRSQRRFTQYFIGELSMTVVNLAVTVGGLLLYRDFRVLAISLSLAQLGGTLYMFYVGREYFHLDFFWDKRIKKLLSHFLQLTLVYGVLHLYILVDKAFASYLGEKSVSALTYGLLIASIPRNILKFEVISITPLSEARGSIKKLSFYLRKLALISVPLVLFFFLFPLIPVRLLFGYGAFSAVDINFTAEALKYYSLSLPFMFLWPVIYRVFQVREKLFAIGVIAILGVLVNGILNYLFVFNLHLGLTGICLGTFGAYIIKCLIGYRILSLKEF